MHNLIDEIRISWRMNVSMFPFQNSLGFPQARAQAIGYRRANDIDRTLGV